MNPGFSLVRHHSSEHLYAVAGAAMFVFGIILGLPGTVLGLPEVVSRFGLTLADRGTLIAALFVGLLVGSLVSGPVVDRIGQRASLVLSAALVAICLPLFAVASSFILASAALAALGLAGAGINTASNALSSDLFPGERARRMNGMAIAVGAGGIALPIVTALTRGHFAWQVIVMSAAVLAVLVLVAAARLRLPAAMPVARAGMEALGHFLKQPGFAWFCVLLALGGANEASTAGWTSTFLLASGFSPVAAAWGLSSLWLGMIVGRLLFAGRVDRAKRTAIVRGGLAGAVCIGLLIATRVPAVLAIAPFLVGTSIAVIMPTSLALAGETYPGNTGTLIGTLLTLSQVGGIAIPALIGSVGELAGIRAGMSVLIVNSAVTAFAAWRAGAGRRSSEVA